MRSGAPNAGLVGHHDFRLATVAAGIWWGTWLAARLPVPVTVLLSIIGIAVCWRGHRGRTAMAVMAAVAMGFTAGAIVTAAQVAVANEVRDLPAVDAKRSVHVELTVGNDPRLLRGTTEPTYLTPVRIHRIRTGDTTWETNTGGVLFAVDSETSGPTDDRLAPGEGGAVSDSTEWSSLLPGQRLIVTGRVSVVVDRPGDLAAITIWSRSRAVAKQVPPWWQTVAGSLRDGLRSACEGLPAGPGGLLPGLVVGDVSNTPQEITEDFRATGMSHLVAVSGSNVAVVVGAVLLVAGALGAGPRWRTAIGCVTIVGFAILARPEPSVLRASVMAAVGLIAIGFGRRGTPVPAVAAAVAGLLLAEPQLASDLGFALSVAATLGLVLLAGRWSRAWRERGWPAWLAMAVAVPLAAQLAVTPLLAAWEGRISLIAVVANAVAAPAVPVATILGLLCCAVSVWWPGAAELLAWLASWPTRWLIVVAEHGAAVPMGSVPWPAGWPAALVLAALLVLAIWLARRVWGRVVIAVGVVMALIATLSPVKTSFTGWPPTGWIMVACDVGQGDALVLSTGISGTAVVVDAGTEPDSVDSCLRDLGVTHVPLMIVSHFHADHVGGVAGVIRGREVAQLMVPHQATPTAGVHTVSEALGAADLPTSAVGAGYRVGRLTVTVLSAGDRFSGTRSDANNDSVVVLAEQNGVRVLLSGDIEEPGQRLLLDSGFDISADILKVPHHGSGYFEPDFFAAVAPTAAVISVGTGNEYGHPHPRVLSELAGLGAVVLRTDRDGTVALSAGAGGLELSRR